MNLVLIINRTILILQLDDWVLCRIYNKKGSMEKQQNGANRKASCLEPEDRKPVILTQGRNAIPPPPPATPSSTPVTTGMNDYLHLDTSESIPRLHTDSSCSEHVVSPEFTCEVQSEPKWREWDKALDFPFNYVDATVDNGFESQFHGSNQMSPLQDMFMYLQKPFYWLPFVRLREDGGSRHILSLIGALHGNTRLQVHECVSVRARIFYIYILKKKKKIEKIHFRCDSMVGISLEESKHLGSPIDVMWLCWMNRWLDGAHWTYGSSTCTARLRRYISYM